MALRKLAITICAAVAIAVFISPGSTLTAKSAAQSQYVAPSVVPATLPQSIILFVGDGMGSGHRQAAQWQVVGEADALQTDALPTHGALRTGSANSTVTDSAAAGTALATGVKTNNGMIAQDPQGNNLITILELAQMKAMSVGLVSTTQLAHATPASFAAHVDSRAKMTEIAAQMAGAGINVLLGGGEDEFLPDYETGCFSEIGERQDGRNLITEMVSAGYTYVCQPGALTSVPTTTTHLLGLFADEGMGRPHTPSLAQMTQTAIDTLSQDPDGFFLMVEGGQIDWAAHANDATLVISDVLALDEAVSVAQAYAQQAAVAPLIIVTADHETGGMGLRLTPSGALTEDGPFTMPDATPFWVTWTTTSHTAQDVPVTAQGNLADRLVGTHENTHVFDMMRRTLFTYAMWLPVICAE